MAQTVETIVGDCAVRNDARYDFWKKIQGLIYEHRYEETLRIILGNCDDSDFDEQVEAVSRSIAANRRS